MLLNLLNGPKAFRRLLHCGNVEVLVLARRLSALVWFALVADPDALLPRKTLARRRPQ
jgi:hypothetical protein